MHRRYFLNLCGVSSTSLLWASPLESLVLLDKDTVATIRVVQEHMFPKNNTIPSAKEFHATEFLSQSVMHPSYDKDFRQLVIEGSKELVTREQGKLLNYNKKELEEALRRYEQSSYGSRWLDRIMVLSLEALYSDPIYGGNYQESGWKSLGVAGGDPRPTTRYIAL